MPNCRTMSIDQCVAIVRNDGRPIKGPHLVMDQQGVARAVVMGLSRFEKVMNAADDWRDLSNPAVQAAVQRAWMARQHPRRAVDRGDVVPLSRLVQQYLDIPEQAVAPLVPFAVYMDANAARQLDHMDDASRRMCLILCKSLEIEPRPEKAQADLMVGAIDLWRLRVGRDRLLYHIFDNSVFVVGVTQATWDIPEKTFVRPETAEQSEGAEEDTDAIT